MKNYSVRMIRENMENIQQFPIPKGFAIRKYRPDEGHIWTRIQRAAERYININETQVSFNTPSHFNNIRIHLRSTRARG